MSVRFQSCGGLGYSPAQMISGFLHSYSKSPNWFQFTDRDIIYTHQGRYAISLLCRLLDIGSGDEVLVPAYNCGAEVDPFIKAGAKTIFYRIDNQLRIDVDDIIGRITPATRIIYVTHFFGWPQEISELANWCENRNIYLVEDCAQSLFSDGSDKKMGQKGVAAIYSFVKSLPVPDGGGLVVKKNIYNAGKPFKPPHLQNILRSSLPLFKKWFMVRYRFWQHLEFTRNLLSKSWLKNTRGKSSNHRPEMLSSNYHDEKKIDWSISRVSKGVLSKTNPNKIIKNRRRNYHFLQHALCDIPTFSLFFDDLPDHVCPLAFPFFVKDRNHWYRALSNKGIMILGWPGYYPGFNWDEYPEACHLKDNLMTLPIHQNLDLFHMEYMVDCIKMIAEGNV